MEDDNARTAEGGSMTYTDLKVIEGAIRKVVDALDRIEEQNDEIIALLREKEEV